MKKALKIAALSVIPVLFYLLISVNAALTVSGNTQYTKQGSPEKEKLNTTDSSVFLCLPSRTKISYTDSKNNPVPTFKKLSTPFFVHTKTAEMLFNVVFFQYTLFSKNVLYRFSQTKILFPFHYFW